MFSLPELFSWNLLRSLINSEDCLALEIIQASSLWFHLIYLFQKAQGKSWEIFFNFLWASLILWEKKVNE